MLDAEWVLDALSSTVPHHDGSAVPSRREPFCSLAMRQPTCLTTGQLRRELPSRRKPSTSLARLSAGAKATPQAQIKLDTGMTEAELGSTPSTTSSSRTSTQLSTTPTPPRQPCSVPTSSTRASCAVATQAASTTPSFSVATQQLSLRSQGHASHEPSRVTPRAHSARPTTRCRRAASSSHDELDCARSPGRAASACSTRSRSCAVTTYPRLSGPRHHRLPRCCPAVCTALAPQAHRRSTSSPRLLRLRSSPQRSSPCTASRSPTVLCRLYRRAARLRASRSPTVLTPAHATTRSSNIAVLAAVPQSYNQLDRDVNQQHRLCRRLTPDQGSPTSRHAPPSSRTRRCAAVPLRFRHVAPMTITLSLVCSIAWTSSTLLPLPSR